MATHWGLNDAWLGAQGLVSVRDIPPSPDGLRWTSLERIPLPGIKSVRETCRRW